MSFTRDQPVVTTTLIHGQRREATRARSMPSRRPGSTMSVRTSRTSGACSRRKASASSAVEASALFSSASWKMSVAIRRTSGSSSTTSTGGARGASISSFRIMLNQLQFARLGFSLALTYVRRPAPPLLLDERNPVSLPVPVRRAGWGPFGIGSGRGVSATCPLEQSPQSTLLQHHGASSLSGALLR